MTSYLDDSGTDNQSPFVVIGGPLFSRIKLKEFSRRWANMLADKQVEGPLHMKDFVGMGRYAGWYPELKRNLFLDAAKIVNDLKFYSLAIVIPRDDFESQLGEDVRRELIGPYAFAFFCVVLSNLKAVEASRLFEGKISYLVDAGSAFPEQLNAAYRRIVQAQHGTAGQTRIGTFDQDTDANVPALQGADMIAWSVRRKRIDGSLPEGFEPIDAVLERVHVSVEIPRDGIAMIANPINAWLNKHGSMPTLDDVVRR